MFSRQWKTLVMLAISILVVGVPLAYADLYWETEQVSQGVPGKQGPAIVKHYYTSKASRQDLADGKIMITDFEAKTVYQIDPATKTYSVMNLADLGGAKEMEGMPADQRKMMESMMGSMQITPTNDTKTINGYNCRKYLMNFMMTSGEYWVSKDVKGLDELKSISEKTAKIYEGNPMLKQMNVAAIMNQMDGFPVQTITQLMGGTITNTLVKMEQKSLSGDLFKVPSDYTQKAMNTP
ncbi:MAG TPA: hypothetical protein DCZ69_19450 [Syntrophobacteraceae bacterium]|jgi:hypothetical protein|nr:hypothetical protein [Syntrophobacteraceae bacterium]HBD10432.1 hypothetical protein [Syntrophobacteraceae bacterium]HBZ54012.1 hypothetical protein [Syntrophobacteraceae bacterium]